MAKQKDKLTVKQEKNVGGRPLKFKTVKDLQSKIDAYFKKCDKGEKREVYDAKKQQVKTIIVKIPYTITGLALALDCDRHTVQDYGKRDEFSTTVKRAKLMVENSYELSLRSNGGAGEIFGLKNFGWKDKQEHDVRAVVETVELSKEEYQKAREEMLKKNDC